MPLPEDLRAFIARHFESIDAAQRSFMPRRYSGKWKSSGSERAMRLRQQRERKSMDAEIAYDKSEIRMR